jgi:NAD(P)-dependent dehydrogenase (short-subunit alcohol dehydrogenase family)
LSPARIFASERAGNGKGQYMKKTVVITGVSTGIGHAAAKVLTERGYHVFGRVRKKAAAVTRGEAQVGKGSLAGLVNNRVCRDS